MVRGSPGYAAHHASVTARAMLASRFADSGGLARTGSCPDAQCTAAATTRDHASNVAAFTVSGKREARKLAKQQGAEPWNF